MAEPGATVIWLAHKLLAFVSNLLVIFGLALIGYGIFHWWKGYPFPVAILMFLSAFGCLGLGAGLSLRWPATTTRLVLAIASFVVSGALFLTYLIAPPWPPAPWFVFVCAVGVLGNLRRYRRLRRRAGPPPLQPGDRGHIGGDSNDPPRSPPRR